MNDILTIKEHQTIHIKNNRDIYNNILSYEDRELLFDIKFIDNNNQEKYVFSNNGKNKIKSNSIVGSISLKNGLIIEILPKFANNSLAKDTLNKYRKTLINMIRVSGKQNFLNTKSQSSKISMGEMPLINYIIELFSKELLNILRRGLYQNYSKETNHSTYIKGNILVSKTIQNNIVDKSKIYSSYNKHSSNNLLMQIFKSLILLLRKDSNLSYNTKQNLYEVTLILSDVNNIQLTNKDFEKITFNRLNDKFEILFSQAKFIFSKYMPFSSSINATPFWSILFNMDYLFEKFIAYLLKKSNIEIEEQSTKDVYKNHKYTVTTKPDFLIKQNIDLFTSKTKVVVDAKWKILDNNKTLYGLNTQNFWQLFSYMNLIENDEVNGYFIVPKNSNNFEDEIIFNPIRDGNKSISILSIDFSLDFNELIERYKFKVSEGRLKLDIQEKEKVLKEISKETVILKDKILDEIEIKDKFKFNFKEFIDELEILYKNKDIRKNLSSNKKNNKFTNLYYLKEKYKVNSQTFKISVKENLTKKAWDFEDLEIKNIPINITKFKNLYHLSLNNNNITILSDYLFKLSKLLSLNIAKNNILIIPEKIFDLKSLKILYVDKKSIDNNFTIFNKLKENDVLIKDENDNNLNKHIESFLIPEKTKEEIILKTEENKEEVIPSIIDKNNNIVNLNNLSKSNKDINKKKLNTLKNNNTNIKKKTSKPIIDKIEIKKAIYLKQVVVKDEFDENYSFAIESYKNSDFEDALDFLKESKVSLNKIKELREKIYQGINKEHNNIKEESIYIEKNSDKIKEKTLFCVKNNLSEVNIPLIEKLSYEYNEDILLEILNKENIKLRFIILIYILNYRNDNITNIIDDIIPLEKEYRIDSFIYELKYNFDNIDKEIIIGYSMSNIKLTYEIRLLISKLTNDLDVLDTLSKNNNDEKVLYNIIYKTKDNPTFIEKIKGQTTIYSTQILARIAKYDKYPNLLKLLYTNFNITEETKEYLYNNYSDILDNKYYKDNNNTFSNHIEFK